MEAKRRGDVLGYTEKISNLVETIEGIHISEGTIEDDVLYLLAKARDLAEETRMLLECTAEWAALIELRESGAEETRRLLECTAELEASIELRESGAEEKGK